MLNSKAVTKIQAIILVTIIVVAGVGGVAAYTLLSGQEQSSETIKIGVCADLDMLVGKAVWQGAVLAAEKINAEGGILGRQVEVIGEDNDATANTFDAITISNSMTRLITLDKVDFIIGGGANEANLIMQDIAAEHQKIFMSTLGGIYDVITQRVADDYDRYKYFFRTNPPNSTIVSIGAHSAIPGLRDLTGFNKIGYIASDLKGTEQTTADFDYYLPEVYGFDLVYRERISPKTIDFSSYFAAAEDAGVEILIPIMAGEEAIPFIKEWYDRQSPMVIWGNINYAQESGFWEWTDGKCEHVSFLTNGFVGNYPMTDYTLSFREGYVERWGETPRSHAGYAIDAIYFILRGAIERAGTTEVAAVVEALEKTNTQTTISRNFKFTSSHDPFFDSNPWYYEFTQNLQCQWQSDGTIVPVYPIEIMEEACATYSFPDWKGPWDEK
ncbi:MAG: ABC transporter substrate-binding protein [Candidatus Micrarchaeota archaeon]